MWAFTGAAFEFHWPEKVYAALLPGEATEDPELTHGSGPLITVDQAVAQAMALHPGTELTSVYLGTPDEPEGSYGIGLSDGGYTPYGYSYGSDTVYVDVDSHGGGTVEYRYGFTDGVPLAQQLWDNGTYFGLHFGSLVPGLPRVIWLVFGLTPVVLAVTGVTVWLAKHRSRRNRRRARRSAGLRAPGK
jgi:uncharacterized iron-regulated membrane protein